MADTIPELLGKIRRDYQNNLMKDMELAQAAKKVEAGTATYVDAENYAYHAGKGMSMALQKRIAENMKEETVIPLSIAEQIMVSMLAENYKVVSGMTTQVQTALNQAAGLGLKALVVEFDKEMAQDLAGKLSGGPLRDTKWVLGAPVISNSQYIVDKSLKKNAAFHAKAGLRPRIIRKAETKCCAWCSGLEGVYEYGSEPKDIYKRHANCRCTVDYKPDEGKRQNVWSKEWHEDADAAKIEKRSHFSGLQTDHGDERQGIRDVTKEYIRMATPGRGSITYDEGYKIGQHRDEIEMAQWILKFFGGDIRLLKEKQEKGIKMPDSIWHNKMWEFKRTKSINGADKLLQTALKQILDNPGGVVLNIVENVSSTDLEKQILSRFRRSGVKEFDLMILSKGKLVKVQRYKK